MKSFRLEAAVAVLVAMFCGVFFSVSEGHTVISNRSLGVMDAWDHNTHLLNTKNIIEHSDTRVTCRAISPLICDSIRSNWNENASWNGQLESNDSYKRLTVDFSLVTARDDENSSDIYAVGLVSTDTLEGISRFALHEFMITV